MLSGEMVRSAAAGGAEPASLRMRLANVRPFPHILARIHAAATDPQETVDHIAQIAEQDVAFAGRMLRLANSAAMGLPFSCASVRQAAVLLGPARIAHLATTTAALAFVSEGSDGAPMVAAHMVAVGSTARALAALAGVSPDDAFTAGLLHDVGMLLMLQSDEPLYEELVVGMGSGEPTIEEEHALLGFDHAALGADVCRAWNLPDPLPDVVALHHDWSGALAKGPACAHLVAVIRLADLLAPRLERSEVPEKADLEALRSEPAVGYLEIPPENIVQMWAGLRRAATAGAKVLHGEPPPLPSLSPRYFISSMPSKRSRPPSLANTLEPATLAPVVPLTRSTRWLVAVALAAFLAIAVLVAFVVAAL